MTLSDRELQSWLFRTIVDRDDEIKQFRKTLESVQRELAESRELALQEQRQNKRSQEKLVELETRLNGSAQTELRMRAELSDLHGQVRVVPSLRTSLEMTQRQLDVKARQCAEYEETIKKLNFQYEDNSMTKARLQELEQKLGEAEKRLGEYEANHQSNTQRLLEAMTERDEARSELEATNDKLVNANSRIQVLEQDKTNLAQSLVNLEGQIRNKTLQVADIRKELDSSKARELELAAKCAAIQSQMTCLRTKFGEMERRISAKPTPDAVKSISAPVPSQVGQAAASRSGQASASAPPAQLVIRLPAQGAPLTPQQSSSSVSPAKSSSSQQSTTPTTPGSAAPAPYNNIPAVRRQVLEAFSTITVPDWSTGEITFSRAELTAVLGGGLQGVDGRFGNPRRVAAAHGLTGCIYPQRQTNPWLPSLPGQHGYMFLGLEGPAKDNVKFFEATERALFIQEGPSSWRYYGLYVIQRHADNDLSKEEWEQFDDSFKDGKGSYSDTTLAKQLGKGYDTLVKNNSAEYRQRTAKIREEYDDGTRRVPCITLRCIHYNEQFFQDILACRPTDRPAAKRKRTPRQLPDGTELPSPTRPRIQ